MNQEIEKTLEEILTLVKKCPPSLQEKCFEVLFEYYFSRKRIASKEGEGGAADKGSSTPEKNMQNDNSSADESIRLSDLHAQVRKLISDANGLTIESINNLFYRENEEFQPLYDDLRTNKMADSQIRLTLLESLRNAMHNGEFKVSSDNVRELCETHKCLSKSNFATTFKTHKNLFKSEYKKGSDLVLSPKGKEELVQIAIEVAQ